MSIQIASWIGGSGTIIGLTSRPPQYPSAPDPQRTCRFARDEVDRSLSIMPAHSYHPCRLRHNPRLQCWTAIGITRLTGSQTKIRSFSYTS